jgi:hypothetical protein
MKIRLAIGALLLSPGTGMANETIELMLSKVQGTLSVKSEPYLSEGKLGGCSLVYSGVLQDWKYREGKFLKVFGNVSIMAANGRLGHMLKVGVRVLNPNVAGFGNEFAVPTRIYLVGKDFSTTLNSSVRIEKADTPGAALGIFQMEPAFNILLSGLKANKLTIAFNSMGGNSDFQLPIELNVVDRKPNGETIRSEVAKTEFIECLTALSENLSK